ncbi:MAG: hypothetical protein IT195_05825 [Microthrixaceae bacterium]|nr:hypothetical protein [Microthrixaceae bacterium]
MASTRHPHPLPSRLAAELQQLADAIATGRVAANSAALVRLARSAESLGLPAGAIAALIDPTSAPIVRERAAVQLSLSASAPASRSGLLKRSTQRVQRRDDGVVPHSLALPG